MSKKTRLKTCWEQSFAGFEELSGTVPSERFTGEGINIDNEVIEQDGEVGEHLPLTQDAHVHLLSLNQHNINPGSPEIDSFIQSVLKKANYSDGVAKAGDVCDGGKDSSDWSPPSAGSTTSSISALLREVLADSPSSRFKEGIKSTLPVEVNRLSEENESQLISPNVIGTFTRCLQTPDQKPLYQQPTIDESSKSSMVNTTRALSHVITAPAQTVTSSAFPTQILSYVSGRGGSIISDVPSQVMQGSVEGFSQTIDYTCNNQHTKPDGSVSPSPPTDWERSQLIFSNSSIPDDIDEDRCIAPSLSSSLQTPELRNKLSELVNNVEGEQCTDSDPLSDKKVGKGGMAYLLTRIIQREESDYTICRHQLTLTSKSSSGSSGVLETPVEIRVIKLVVTEDITGSGLFIHTVVVSCDCLDSVAHATYFVQPGTQAMLLSSRLKREDNSPPRRNNEVRVYWPWRVHNSQTLGTVIVTNSVCDIIRSSSQSENSLTKVPTINVVGSQSCPCMVGGGCSGHPVYSGPFAFLHQ